MVTKLHFFDQKYIKKKKTVMWSMQKYNFNSKGTLRWVKTINFIIEAREIATSSSGIPYLDL